VVLDGAYCGLAPVPGGRVNVGIVLASDERRATLERFGARATVDAVVAEASLRAFGRPLAAVPLDRVAGASPIAHRVERLAGHGWLLVGDAAGFLDPFTGEGLHRALVSARLADAAVSAWLGGSRSALGAYDATMRRRFLGKDVISWIVQAFLGRPALFAYAARRLATRPPLAERMGLVMADLVPASAGLDPRFLAAILRP
jgi:flavin-dependent dehydrogenase